MTYIAASKEESIKTDKECFSDGIRIYTDGSGLNRKIGAAAILFSGENRLSSATNWVQTHNIQSLKANLSP
jgi:hypothetical protein